ncbi:hypothetical protein Ancab_003734 [Ancistrocladus abbreviatus]
MCCLIMDKKSRRKDGFGFGDECKQKPSFLRQVRESKLREALEEAPEDGSLFKSTQDIETNSGPIKITAWGEYQYLERLDQLRSDEYGHLFGLSEIIANLSKHALYGGAEEGTVEHDIKTRIMDHLTIPENEYGIVVTVGRGSAFKLLAKSYPF